MIMDLDRQQQVVEEMLAEARAQGATAAEAAVSADESLSVTVRLGALETVEQSRDHSLGITVYMGQRKGSSSTTDFSPAAIRESVKKACTIARYTSEDPYAGLADPAQQAKDYPDLDLCHPWQLDVAEATEIATACEQAARDADSRITNSEGATVNSHVGGFIYGNSNGFMGGYPVSRHNISCVVMAQDGNSMQRDYWYDSSRLPGHLETPEAIGREAARRTLDKLHARKLGTCQAPVLFSANMASSLMRSLIGAIRGHAQYRKSSFLLDALGQQILPEWVQIHENPLLPRGLASAPFDSEGVATRGNRFVVDGVLNHYVLDSYAARKLEMETTGNAGGVRNLTIDTGSSDREALIREMGRGLLVTELLGQGFNPVTGDYSRGAAGFWVEQGEIQYPVEEITIAGNMKQMLQQLVAVGNDIHKASSIRTGSWLIENMTIAGD